MIRKGAKEAVGLHIGRRAVTAAYRGARLVWELVSSCFGAGHWRGEQPWKGGDGWRGS